MFLLDGLVSTLRLPSVPVLAVGGAEHDGVFQRIITLPKGRTLLAKALPRFPIGSARRQPSCGPSCVTGMLLGGKNATNNPSAEALLLAAANSVQLMNSVAVEGTLGAGATGMNVLGVSKQLALISRAGTPLALVSALAAALERAHLLEISPATHKAFGAAFGIVFSIFDRHAVNANAGGGGRQRSSLDLLRRSCIIATTLKSRDLSPTSLSSAELDTRTNNASVEYRRISERRAVFESAVLTQTNPGLNEVSIEIPNRM